MPGDVYPKLCVAAVQAAPVFLNRDATIDRLDFLVQKAVDAGWLGSESPSSPPSWSGT